MKEKRHKPVPRPLDQEDLDLMGVEDGYLPQKSLDDHVEGLDAIRKFLNPHMSASAFYLRHRQAIDYILFVDKENWRDNRARFFTTKRLLYHYMLKTRIM